MDSTIFHRKMRSALICIIYSTIWSLIAVPTFAAQDNSKTADRHTSETCGYDTAFVVLRMHDKIFNSNELKSKVNKDGTSNTSLRRLAAVLNEYGVETLVFKNKRCFKRLNGARGIIYLPGEDVGHYAAFVADREEFRMFSPPHEMRVGTKESFLAVNPQFEYLCLVTYGGKMEFYIDAIRIAISAVPEIILYGIAISICILIMIIERRIWIRRACLGTICILALTFIVTRALTYGATDKTPKIEVLVPYLTLKLGQGHPGETRAFNFKIKNTGSAMLNILSVQANCPCIANVKCSARDLLPNQEAIINGEYHYGGFAEKSRKNLVIRTNMVKSPITKVAITSITSSPIGFEKLRLIFSKVKAVDDDQKRSLHVRVYPDEDGKSISIVSVKCKVPWIEAEFHQLEDATLPYKLYRIDARVTRDAPEGELDEVLAVLTDATNPKLARFEVAICGVL